MSDLWTPYDNVPYGIRDLPEKVGRAIQTPSVATSRKIQDQMFKVLAARMIKFAQGAIALRDQGYAECGIVLLRSIYESHLWMRWVLSSEKRAQHYWTLGQREAARHAAMLVGRHGVKAKHGPDPDIFTKLYNAKDLKKVRLPEFVEVARDVGLEKLHDIIYPFLSWMAHGNPMSLGEALARTKEGLKLPVGASDLNVESFDQVAGLVSIPSVVTVEWWVSKRELAPPFRLEYKPLES